MIHLLVGSVYGGASMLANDIAATLRSAGSEVHLMTAPVFDDVATSHGPLLVCTSTTGHGELPPVLALLCDALRDGLPWQPGRPFGIVMLGDSSYPTFCGGGEQMRDVLLEMGCREVLPALRIDAIETTDGSAAAREWTTQYLSALGA